VGDGVLTEERAMIERDRRKVREGVVVSDRMDKTIVVEVARLVRHRRYKRVLRRASRCTAHDGQNECGVGDRVRIMETRPLSKRKRWRLVSVVEKAK
jgi:small subunit ribosomal protein S17